MFLNFLKLVFGTFVFAIAISPKVCNSFSATEMEKELPIFRNLVYHLEKEIQQLENSFSKLASSGFKIRVAVDEKGVTDGKNGTNGEKEKDQKDKNNGKDGNSWAKLEISPNSIATVLYNDFLVNIYEHSGNRRITEMDQNSTLRKYYYAPLALLNVLSARCFKNELIDQFEMEFHIELWNDAIQKQVTTFIRTEFDWNVMNSSIQIIPFKELILTSSSSIFKKKYKFSVDTWLTYQQRQSIPFSLFIESMEHCQKIISNMREEPESFRSLRLQFRVDSETSQTKETIISIQSIMNGDLMSKLDQQLPTAQFALLREGDTQQMLSESASNILFDQFDDSEIVSPNAESELLPIIKATLLEATNIAINQSSTAMYDNVFWNADSYRPDKLTKNFNQVYDTLNTAAKKKLKDTMTSKDKLSFETTVEVPEYLKIQADADIEHGRENSKTKESIEQFLKESKEKVQWDGVKFVPKPMSCSRVNLAKLRDSKTLVDRSVKVQYSTSTLSVQVNMPPRLGLLPAYPLIEMERKIKELSTKVNSQVNRVNNLGPMMAQKLDDVDKQMQSIDILFKEIDGKKENLEHEITQELLPKPIVIFDAYLMEPKYDFGSMISYTDLQVNISQEMCIDNGVFIAQIEGIYEFTFHGISGSDGPVPMASVNLMVNGRALPFVRTDSYLLEGKIQLAMSTILPLKKNDFVACLLNSGHLVNFESYEIPNAHFTVQLLYSSHQNASFPLLK